MLSCNVVSDSPFSYHEKSMPYQVLGCVLVSTSQNNDVDDDEVDEEAKIFEINLRQRQGR